VLLNLRSLARLIFTAAVLAVAGAPGRAPCHGDEFQLRNGGRIDGTWLNRQQGTPQQYEIAIAGGGKLTLDASQVQQALVKDVAETAYDRIRSRYPDTVEGQWQLAEWCREHGLKNLRQQHLRRVVQLEPDHVDARHGLGYSQVRGQWVTPEEIQRRRGYILHEGRWRLAQEVTLLDRKQADEQAQKNWLVQLRRWREVLGTADARTAHDDISAVRDPHAIGALAVLLKEERHRNVKMLYIDVLAEIGGPQAIETLLNTSLQDGDEEIFHASLDKIVRINPPHVAAKYAEALKDENNIRINRAAYALGRLQDKSVLSPLIDALITTHYTVIPKGADNYTTGFASPVLSGPQAGSPSSPLGGTSFSAGGETKVIPHTVNNQQVLDALIRLGGANFGFDQRAWRYWLANENRKAAPQLNWRKE
jgi:hypothetical protein